MALPNFICVGAEKAGTTPLAEILGRHPDVFVTPYKETYFFTRFYGRENGAFYETRFFQSHAGEKAVGELTPEYMRIPEVPARLRQHLGAGLKLIFCLRHPVRRAFSHYLQCVRILEEDESFETAVALEPSRIAENPFRGMRRAYIEGGRYAAQIRRFLEHFPREQMFFMVLEDDFIDRRRETMRRLFEFLGVAPDPDIDLAARDTSLAAPRVRVVGMEERVTIRDPRHERLAPPGTILIQTGNRGLDRVIYHPSATLAEFVLRLQRNMTRELSPERAAELYDRYFRDEVTDLEELLGRDLSLWGAGREPLADRR